MPTVGQSPGRGMMLPPSFREHRFGPYREHAWVHFLSNSVKITLNNISHTTFHVPQSIDPETFVTVHVMPRWLPGCMMNTARTMIELAVEFFCGTIMYC